MKKRIIVSLMVLVLVLATTLVGCSSNKTPAPAAPGNTGTELKDPVNLDLATFNMGSAWYSYGPVLSELMLKELPSGSKVNVLQQAGAAANPKLVAEGKAPIAIGFNQACNWAYNGKYMYDKPYNNLRGLVGYLDTYYYAAVVSKSFGVTDLAEVKAKKIPIRVSTVPVGGLGEIVTRLIFEHYGFTYEDIKSWGGKVEHNDFNTIVQKFKDGQTDFFLQNITQGHAAITELAVTTPVIFLQFPDDMINAFSQKYGFSIETLPANSFNGQTTAIKSLGLTSNLFCTADLPEAVAYALTKAVVENPDAIHSGHVALKRFDPKDASDPIGVGLPLHPGAEKYYKEKGLLK